MSNQGTKVNQSSLSTNHSEMVVNRSSELIYRCSDRKITGIHPLGQPPLRVSKPASGCGKPPLPVSGSDFLLLATIFGRISLGNGGFGQTEDKAWGWLEITRTQLEMFFCPYRSPLSPSPSAAAHVFPFKMKTMHFLPPP
jgi:hypothetical protein